MPDNTTLDDASDFFTYGGDTWGTNHIDDPMTPQYSEGTFHTTTVHQAWARLCWTGADITIFGAKRGNHGLYATVIDNGDVTWGDGYSEKAQIQAVLFASSSLEWGDHQVSISNQNKVNQTKGRIWLDVDHVNFVGWPIDCNGQPDATVKPSNTFTVDTTTAIVPSTSGTPSSVVDGSQTNLIPVSVTASANSTSAIITVSTTPVAVSPTTTVTLSSTSAGPSTSGGAVAGSDSGASLSIGINGQLALFGVVATYLLRRFA